MDDTTLRLAIGLILLGIGMVAIGVGLVMTDHHTRAATRETATPERKA